MSPVLLLAAESSASAPWFTQEPYLAGLAVICSGFGIWLMLPGQLTRQSVFAPYLRAFRRGDSPHETSPPEFSDSLGGVLGWAVFSLTTIYGIGAALSIAGLALLFSLLPTTLPMGWEPVLFWIMSGLTLVSATATITMQSPVYSAIWFALTLLGAAGLLFLHGAQFLGVATVVVYAGAILVTFLFVLMLSQPEGHSYYDRLSWGWAPAAMATFSGVALLALIVFSLVRFDETAPAGKQADIAAAVESALYAPAAKGGAVEEEPADKSSPEGNSESTEKLPYRVVFVRETSPGAYRVALVRDTAVADTETIAAEWNSIEEHVAILGAQLAATEGYPENLALTPLRSPVGGPQQVAQLGGDLFSRHLIAVQAAGALLLAALVGAVAIVIQGRRAEEPDADDISQAEAEDESGE